MTELFPETEQQEGEPSGRKQSRFSEMLRRFRIRQPDQQAEISQTKREELETLPTPKSYFHATQRAEFDISIGVVSQEGVDNVTDFISWSLFFPYEKIGRQFDDGRNITMMSEDGTANFSLWLMDEHAPVLKVPDERKRAFTAKNPVEIDYSDKMRQIGMIAGGQKLVIEPKHILAEIPITRELQSLSTKLKVEIVTQGLSEAEIATKFIDYFHTCTEGNKLQVLSDETSDETIAQRLAHSLMRDYTIRYLPAVKKLIQESDQFDLEQKSHIWQYMGKGLQSKSLRRYYQTLTKQLTDNKLINLEVDRKPLTEETLSLLISELGGLDGGKGYFSYPGDMDFMGYYFSSGELTFWAKRKGKKELIASSFTSDRTRDHRSIEDLVLLTDAYIPESEQIWRSRMLGGMDLESWPMEQMKDDVVSNPQAADQYREKNRSKEDQREQKFWNDFEKITQTPAKGETKFDRFWRLSLTQRALGRLFIGAQGERYKHSCNQIFSALTGIESIGDREADKRALMELGVSTDKEDLGDMILEGMYKDSISSTVFFEWLSKVEEMRANKTHPIHTNGIAVAV